MWPSIYTEVGHDKAYTYTCIVNIIFSCAINIFKILAVALGSKLLAIALGSC